MKWIKWFFEIVIGVALLYWSVRLVFTSAPTRVAAAKDNEAAIFVTVETPQPLKIEDVLICLGTVASRESVDLSAQVTEKVIALHFDHGQSVKKGDLLVELQDAQEQAAIKVADLAIEEHQREEERLVFLLKEDAVPQKDLDDRRTRLAMAKIEKEKAEADSADRKIVAPFSGLVGLRLVSLGDLVTPGTKITTLDDITRVYVDFPVPEKYMARLATGMVFRASNAAYPGTNFEGMITMIDPRIQPQTRSAQVRGAMDNVDLRLRPGMLMTVTLNMGSQTCRSVSEESLVILGEKHFVFVYAEDQKKVFRREVKIGRRSEGRAEILSGLDDQTVIVKEGTAKISDGRSVTLEEPK